MKCRFLLAVLVPCLVLSASFAQNTTARATPQTQGAAPAGIGPDATAAQAGTASADRTSGRISGRRGRAGSTRTGGEGGTPRGQAGITGVPAYDPGGGQGTGPAPASTSRVVVTGDSNGNPVSDPGAASLNAGPQLPGVTLQHNSLGVKAGTLIQVRLRQSVDSGHAKNGQTVNGALTAPLGKVPAGAPVQLTVVAVARAGEISSDGELSLQVISVNGEPALSEVVTAEGKEGAKTLPDDAPARGTEAIFTPDQTITLPAA